MPTDDLRAALRPLPRQAKGTARGPRPKAPDRDFFEAPLDPARTGIPWRDLPAESGRREAIGNRFRRRVAAGGLRRRFEPPTADPQGGDVRRGPIGATIVRAHRHAAGARRERRRSGPSGQRAPEPSAAVAGARAPGGS